MRAKIVFVSGSRADFGLIQDTLRVFSDSKQYSVTLMRIGHSLAEENDYLSRITGLKVDRLETTLGVNNILSQREYGLAVGEIVQVVSRYLSGLQPDIVFLAGDRFEILASCVASFYLRIPVGHLHGGDRSVGGHIDDNARHAITKMAQVHFVVCDDSYQRILRLGEHEERIYNVGSPVVDNISSIEFKRTVKEPYAIFTYHPLASKPSIGHDETAIILNVLGKQGVRTLITSPNNEVGANGIIEAIKKSCSRFPLIEFVGNCGWEKYLNLLRFSMFGIGNSSSLLLEAPILKTPSINVGARQLGRFSPKSVIHSQPVAADLISAIERVSSIDRSALNHPYGTGGVGKKILNAISYWIEREEFLLKRITY